MRIFFVIGLAACAVLPASVVAAAASCVVDDPTPTPLNIRTAPNGQIVGDIENGRHVTVIDRTIDDRGRPWVYIADEQSTPMGWVFRQYIKCN